MPCRQKNKASKCFKSFLFDIFVLKEIKDLISHVIANNRIRQLFE